MATVNQGVVRMSQIDFDGQKRQFSFPTVVVTAVNFAAQLVLHDALVAAIDDVTLGNTDFEEFVADRESIRPVILPAAASAQVNIQWVVTYVDAVTGTIANVRVPCADILDTTLFAPSSNLWDPADAKWVTFIAAFEAYVLSEEGNAVVVQQVAYLQ